MNRKQVEQGFVFIRLEAAVCKLFLVRFAGIDSCFYSRLQGMLLTSFGQENINTKLSNAFL